MSDYCRDLLKSIQFSWRCLLAWLISLLVVEFGCCVALGKTQGQLGINGLTVNRDGSFLFDGVPFAVAHLGLAWVRTAQPHISDAAPAPLVFSNLAQE